MKEQINRYFYAKIGKGNKYVRDYLSSNNELGAPSIPIYFNGLHESREDFILSGGSREQGKKFFECGDDNEGKFIIVINDGFVSVLSVCGSVQFRQSNNTERHQGWVKLLPVSLLKSFPIADVPTVLAGIAANRYYSSGTFREIKNPGNVLAIQHLLKHSIDNITSPLSCLSSFELETLIAKIFEEANCFVPAYRGGTMQGVDLFAFNRTSKEINIAGVSIPPAKRISIQVKLNSSLQRPPAGIDYLIGLEITGNEQCHGSKWISDALSSSPTTAKWLKQSLDWLPNKYLDQLP